MDKVLKCALLFLVFFSGACVSEDDIQLQYSVTVPADIPATITLNPEVGDPYDVNAIEMYEKAHRKGWMRFVADFSAEGLAAASAGSLMPSHQFGLQVKGERAGYADCASAVAALVDAHGEEAVKQAVMTQYAAELADIT